MPNWALVSHNKKGKHSDQNIDRANTNEEISAGCGKFVLGCMVGAVASQVHSGEATVSGELDSQGLTG